MRIVREAGFNLGLGLAGIVNIFSPEAIVIVGGLTQMGEPYLQTALDTAKERSYVHKLRPVDFRVSAAATDSAAVGAALVAFESVTLDRTRPTSK